MKVKIKNIITQKARKAQAFTLIELMVAATVASIFLIALLSLYSSAASTWAKARKTVNSFREARNAIRQISLDFSGFYRAPKNSKGLDKFGTLFINSPDTNGSFPNSGYYYDFDTSDSKNPDDLSEGPGNELGGNEQTYLGSNYIAFVSSLPTEAQNGDDNVGDLSIIIYYVALAKENDILDNDGRTVQRLYRRVVSSKNALGIIDEIAKIVDDNGVEIPVSNRKLPSDLLSAVNSKTDEDRSVYEDAMIAQDVIQFKVVPYFWDNGNDGSPSGEITPNSSPPNYEIYEGASGGKLTKFTSGWNGNSDRDDYDYTITNDGTYNYFDNPPYCVDIILRVVSRETGKLVSLAGDNAWQAGSTGDPTNLERMNGDTLGNLLDGDNNFDYNKSSEIKTFTTRIYLLKDK